MSRDLLASERPRDLNAEEQAEYGVLLEEQAFPFEEKAIELYRVNAERVSDGVYDEWVRASFARLAVMAPARYARTERSEDVAAWKAPADHPELAGPLVSLAMVRARAGDDAAARALFERASTVCNRCGPVWNELGVLHRQQGRFADAEQAYQRAIELEPGYALPYYNLAMLYELYIPRPDLALQSYEQYLQLGGASDEGQQVEKWVADLRRRAEATPKTARAEGAT